MAYGTGHLGLGQFSPYEQEHINRQQALLGYDRAAASAGRSAMGAARTLGTGNPIAALRSGTAAASHAAGQIMGQRAGAEAQMVRADQQRARMEHQAGQERARQTLGNLLGGAAGLVGTIVPGMGAAGGAIGGLIGGQAPGQAPAAPQGSPVDPGPYLAARDARMERAFPATRAPVITDANAAAPAPAPAPVAPPAPGPVAMAPLPPSPVPSPLGPPRRPIGMRPEDMMMGYV